MSLILGLNTRKSESRKYMGFISKRKKVNIFHNRNIEREFALQILEIIEEKLAESNMTLSKRLKNGLVTEIEDFININKRVLFKKIA